MHRRKQERRHFRKANRVYNNQTVVSSQEIMESNECSSLKLLSTGKRLCIPPNLSPWYYQGGCGPSFLTNTFLLVFILAAMLGTDTQRANDFDSDLTSVASHNGGTRIESPVVFKSSRSSRFNWFRASMDAKV